MPVRTTVVTLALLTLGILATGSCKLLSDEGCASGGEATVAQYEDCKQRCKQGDRDACNRRSEVESGLNQACHLRASTGACKALCEGRKHDQRACQRLRDLRGNN